MKNALSRNAKPGAGTPGFAQSTCRLVASFTYGIGKAGANARLPLVPVAMGGARHGLALFWGGLR